MVPISLRCLQCGSENLDVPGHAPYPADATVTCNNCEGTWQYGEFEKATMERIDRALQEGGNPNARWFN